ncbi:MAG: carboxypeptidase-like regulatory domain-containing protein, partial [Isosphaeraceae bacterium]
MALAVMLLSFTNAHAQQLTATLSGIVADRTDARVPGAMILVINQASGDQRQTESDSQGFFSVTSLVPGMYKVTISAKTFSSWAEDGIVLNQGDSRTLPNIQLKIGSEAETVTVISGADAEVPVDTAEVSATLNNELVDSAILSGRNAAELIKVMPGVAFNNGGSAGSGYNGQITGTNNGPAGAF